jgi:hypothetical protein
MRSNREAENRSGYHGITRSLSHAPTPPRVLTSGDTGATTPASRESRLKATHGGPIWPAPIEAARADLISRGVEVSDLFHRGESGFVPGPDPERRSYLTYASFDDPDGNGWLLQEVSTRLSGRDWGDSIDIASLADLLHETSLHHGEFEAVAPAHNWWDWYPAYANARKHGSTEGEAAAAAGHYMAEAKHVIVSPA